MDNVYEVVCEQRCWRGSPLINVTIVGLDRTVRIPVAFLNPPTWRYISTILGYLVNEEGGTVCHSASNEPIDTSIPPSAGDYHYIPKDSGTVFTDAAGPSGKRRRVPPRDDGSTTTMSASSRSSAHQNKFREAIQLRDFQSIITGASRKVCEASHIVPVSRDDVTSSVYQRIYGARYIIPMYRASAGFLLDLSYHKQYDRYAWSMYYEDGYYYPHFFSPNEQERYYHGIRIARDRFRIEEEENELPDPQLCAWHYKQFVLMRFRGEFVSPGDDSVIG